MLPPVGALGEKVALRRTVGSMFTTPMQLGPTSRMPARRHTASSSRCRCAPSSPVSAKPPEIITSDFTPFHRAVPGDLHRGRRRDGDHREVDRARDVQDRPVGRHRLDHVGVRVDRVDGPREIAVEQVVEQLPADRPASSRGAHDRDRGGVQQGPHRRGGGDLLPVLEALPCRAGQLGRELDQDRPRLDAQRGGEAALAEDLQHARVLGEDLRAEGGDPVVVRALPPVPPAGAWRCRGPGSRPPRRRRPRRCRAPRGRSSRWR